MIPRASARNPVRAALLLWLAALLLAWPVGEFPLFDDWAYARPAFRLAATGVLAIPEAASAVPAAQIAWGAAFVKVFGASHFVLRLATIVAVALGALCWRRTLRLLGFDDTTTAWALGVALLSPAMLLLTSTFMTDAPFVAAAQAAVLAGLLWAAKPSWRRMMIAAALALVTAFVRQPGAAMLVGLAAAAIAAGRREQALVPFAAAAAVIFGQLSFANGLGARLPLVERAADAFAFMHVPLGFYVQGFIVAAAFVGLCVAPAALAVGEHKIRAVLAWLAVLVLAWIVWGTPVLRDGTMWGACELGGARSLLAGRPDACAWAPLARAVAVVLAAIGLATLARVAVARGKEAARMLREPTARLPQPYDMERSRDDASRSTQVVLTVDETSLADALRRTRIFLAVTFTVLTAGMLVLWLFADRYWLLPAALAPALVLRSGVRRPRLGAAAVVAYALVAVLGTRGVFSFYAKVNAATDTLVARGISPDQIDSGYCVNAARLYLMQPPAPRGEGRNANVPWVSAVEALPWTIANRLEEGWMPARLRSPPNLAVAADLPQQLPTLAREGLIVELLRPHLGQRASSEVRTARRCE